MKYRTQELVLTLKDSNIINRLQLRYESFVTESSP